MTTLDQAIEFAEAAYESVGTVMVAPFQTLGKERIRHNRLFKDEGGLYVRRGKRATVQE
jgi:hypothetical protein